MTRILLSLFAMCFVLSSCFKEDDMVPRHPRPNDNTDTIDMTENYLHQVWYSLDSGRAVQTLDKTGYDLGFECSAGGWHILLNSANFMKAADLGVVPFGQPYDTTGLALKFDKSDGNLDSTAIGTWNTVAGADTNGTGHVFAVSRGLDELGNPLGLYQVIFDSLRDGQYFFRFAPLKGGSPVSATVRKNNGVSFRWFSFVSGITVDAEPPREAFDIQFTQYTTLLFTDQGIPYPYLVTGVLLNRDAVAAAVDSVYDYSTITRDQALSLDVSRSLDVIGYDWKYYNFSTGLYTIHPNLCYVIRSVSGTWYKLRFVGFYSKVGLKGYPAIEFGVLN